MKNFRCLLICMFIGLLMSACTQPNGYIGPLFGQWIFESIQAESGPLTHNPQQFNLRFQGGVAMLTQTTAQSDYWPKVATWADEDGILTLDFQSVVTFSPLLGFGTTQTVRLQIDQLTSKSMKLTLLDADKTVRYSLKKLE